PGDRVVVVAPQPPQPFHVADSPRLAPTRPADRRPLRAIARARRSLSRRAWPQRGQTTETSRSLLGTQTGLLTSTLRRADRNRQQPTAKASQQPSQHPDRIQTPPCPR